MSILRTELTRALWYVAMQKHLRILPHTNRIELHFLQAYKWHTFGVNLVAVHGAWVFSKRKLLRDIQDLARLQSQVV